mmetsp:Transcript_56464/g.148478  ORF Transcript_56464/g.148478 Transcript_56464/m.148478 type:complete len:206 (+) Transcript_56464:1023-1640(+)
MSLIRADLARESAELLASGLTTATRAAAEAGTAVAWMSACRGVISAEPASTIMRMRDTVQGSWSEDRISGKGSETPSSGSMSQAPSAPSSSMRGAPAMQGTSSPTTMGSSCISRSTFCTRSTSSLATTRIMPRPQLNVEASSLACTLPTAASQRRAVGSSQASAWSRAASCLGSTASQQRRRPPRDTCAAPLMSLSLASFRTGLA